jgi:putative nucleotidyltransferase with HDIG domain
MKNRYSYLLLAMGVLLLVVVWGNDVRALMLRHSDYQTIGFAGYCLVLAGLVIYAGYLKIQLTAMGRRLAGFRHAWREASCAVAVIKDGTVTEVCGEGELFGLLGPPTAYEAGEAGDRPGGWRVWTESFVDADGQERVFERRRVPLPEFAGGECKAEIVFDISARTQAARQRENAYGKMLKILVNSFEMKDPYCQGHSETVSNLAQELAAALGMPETAVAGVARAALLHDIGKIIIPPEIINKTEELSPAEFETIKAHPEIGADILASLEIFQAEAAFVRFHHERFDGGGYPLGLRGEAIPLGARILSVADAFDAMTAGRSVRGRRDVTAALTIIEDEKGRQFDPQVASAFVAMVRAGRSGGRG